MSIEFHSRLGRTLLTIIWDDPSQATAGANFAALTAYVTIAFIVPLCFLKDMSYLGFTSFLSLLPLIYMYGFQVFCFSLQTSHDTRFFWGFERTFPMFPTFNALADLFYWRQRSGVVWLFGR
jgi:hypothetical protein